MKKLYQEEPWLRASRRRVRHELARGRWRKQWRKELNRTPERNSKRPGRRKSVVAPTVLSLTKNPDETLKFFSEVLRRVRRHKDVFLDLSKVQTITVDAVMCIMAVLESARATSPAISVAGNSPEDEECSRTLAGSGFYRFVYSALARPPTPPNDNLFSMLSGTIAVGTKAEEVQLFFAQKLGLDPDSVKCKSVYSTLIECMANTVHHAYTKRNRGLRKWWLMCQYEPTSRSVYITFLDNGHGIPSTVRQRLISDVLARYRGIRREDRDSYLIASAMEGRVSRTSTGEEHRGKGLPFIREQLKVGVFSELSVVSNRGVVDCRTGEGRALSGPFLGTMINWAVEADAVPTGEQ